MGVYSQSRMWVCDRDVRLIVIATKIDFQEAYGDLKIGTERKRDFCKTFSLL